MSIIFIKDRVTSNAEKFKDNVASNLSYLLVEPTAKIENFSVELTVGSAWSESYGQNSSQMQRIALDGLELGRHGSIVVEVAEKIKVPYNMYGIIVPTGSLFLDRGVLIAPAKVEPSYTGKLKLRLFNTTSLKHAIRPGDKLASILFFATEKTRFHEDVSKDGILVDVPVPFPRKFQNWSRKNFPQIITWLIAILSSSVVSASLVYFAFPAIK